MTSSNRLPILASEIRRAHADVQDAAKTAAQRAIDAGHALIEAKELVEHGGWLPWLREHCALAERTAQLYMKIAKSGLESATVADLGLNAASRSLTIHLASAFDEDNPAQHEWLLLSLWNMRAGMRCEDAFSKCEWLRRVGWGRPSDFFTVEGERWCSRWGGKIPQSTRDAWAEFFAANQSRSKEDIESEMQRLAEAETPPPARNRRKARR